MLTAITAWSLIVLGMLLGAAGGHGSFGTTPGDSLVAYALK